MAATHCTIDCPQRASRGPGRVGGWERSWPAAQERARPDEPALGSRLWKAQAHLQGRVLARGPEEALGLAGALGTHWL